MAAPGVWGDEFRVNAVTVGAQLSPVVAALAGGGFAVAYTDYSRSTAYGFTDRSDSAVRVQVFASDGSADGSPVQVNTVAQFFQHSPRIAGTADGGFVVTYTDLSAGFDSYNDDIWGEAVRMQRFGAGGAKLGQETRVNTTVYGDQDHSNVALLDNGNLLVTWDEGYADADENIAAQLFDATGDFLGAEVILNADLAGSQTGSDIAALPGGGYAITFVDSSGADGDGGGIFVRVFAADGTPLTADIHANTTTASDQYQPSITALVGGGFFVVWTDNSRGVETGGDDTSSYALRGQVFDAVGTKVGTEVRVNATTTYGQVQPDVLALSDGRFVVAWSDTSMGTETGGDDAEFGAIRARVFNADGSADSDEFLVNATTVGHQNEPQMAQLQNGHVVFTWTDYSYGAETGGDDADNGAIRARILDLGLASGDPGDGGDGSGSGSGGSGGGDQATSGDDTLSGTGADDALSGGDGNDSLSGMDGSDTLRGDDGNDILKGNNGRDILVGGAGRDELYGGYANDKLKGKDGDDKIKGGAGKDVIVGGPGADTLIGGGDADVFVYTNSAESAPGSSNRDEILDFTDNVDRIKLRAIDADPSTDDDDAFTFIGRLAFTGTAGEIHYHADETRTVVKIDLDGDKELDMKICLSGWHELDADDFVL